MKDSVLKFGKPVLKNLEYKVSDEHMENKKVNLHRCFHSNIIRVTNENESIVELTIQIGCDEKSVNPPFSLELTIGARFHWNEDLEEDFVAGLLEVSAPALLVGYARPIIANITSNSIGQYDLPFVDFTK